MLTYQSPQRQSDKNNGAVTGCYLILIFLCFMPSGMARGACKQFILSDIKLVMILKYFFHSMLMASGAVVGGVAAAGVADSTFQRPLFAMIQGEGVLA